MYSCTRPVTAVAADMLAGLCDVRTQGIATTEAEDIKSKSTNPATYTEQQWITKALTGLERLSVADCSKRSSNGVKSFHAKLRRRVMVAHQNIFTFAKHL